jgi:hypothetical protein
MFLAACAGGVSTIAFSADGPTLTAADYKKLSNAPKTPADHRSLAKHYRAIASQHEAEAKAFEALATQYAKGVPGAADSHARELARAAKHVGGHTRDFIEALVEMAEVHEGIAEGPLK